MTVLERLRSTGAPEAEAQRAASAIGALLPVDRGVFVTDEILDAARAGDLALVVMLLAEEVEPEADEINALNNAEREDDGMRSTISEVRARLGL